MKSTTLPLLALLIVLAGCRSTEPLPVIGHLSQPFRFTDQDNLPVTLDTLKGKIVVTDFFFTSCPTICPLMKTQMKRVYDTLRDEPDLLFLSHSIDPEYDTVEHLHDYAAEMGIDSGRWHMVTGPKNEIYAMAKEYMLGVVENRDAPGGYIHSGSFCLLDRRQRIRGYYDGTDAKAVDTLIRDIRRLLEEQ